MSNIEEVKIEIGTIYLVINKINNKCYVGKTTKLLDKRKHEHLKEARLHVDNTYSHNAIRKYGENNFEWKVITRTNDATILNDLEKFYIFKFQSYENGYNLTKGGEGCLGLICSPETRKKLSMLNSGENNPNYGKPRSLETRKKMSETHKRNGYHIGKKQSKETCEKKSKSLKGRIFSKETKYKISKAKMGNFGNKKGLFGFRGVNFQKYIFHKERRNPWKRVWRSKIQFRNYNISLGTYEDPLSCEIVHDLVWNEICEIIT